MGVLEIAKWIGWLPAAGVALALEVQSLLEPSKRHVLEVKRE